VTSDVSVLQKYSQLLTYLITYIQNTINSNTKPLFTVWTVSKLLVSPQWASTPSDLTLPNLQ